MTRSIQGGPQTLGHPGVEYREGAPVRMRLQIDDTCQQDARWADDEAAGFE